MTRFLTLAALLVSCATSSPADGPTDPQIAPPESTSGTESTGTPPNTTGGTDTTTTITTTTTTTETADTGLPAAVCDGRTVGTTVGACAQDFTLLDANGTAVTLSDFAGDVIVIDFSAMWCGFCQNLAPELEALNQAYAGQGLTVLTVLFQNIDGDDPTTADLQAWASAFSSTHGVLGDVGEVNYTPYDAGGQPTGVVIDRNFDIVWKGAGGVVQTSLEDQIVPLL